MAVDYTGNYSGIAKGEQVRASDMTAALNKMEKVSSKKDTINDDPIEYPSSKAILNELRVLRQLLQLPAGIIFPYAGGGVADEGLLLGWCFCNGNELSRTGYPALFEAIGTTWGVGNGSTTFNVPDLRGATIRGVGTSTIFKNTLTDRADNATVTLGQIDHDAIRNITGHLGQDGFAGNPGVGVLWNGTGALYINSSLQGGRATYVFNTPGSTGNVMFDASRSVPTAAENKVKARGVNFIIKIY